MQDRQVNIEQNILIKSQRKGRVTQSNDVSSWLVIRKAYELWYCIISIFKLAQVSV